LRKLSRRETTLLAALTLAAFLVGWRLLRDPGTAGGTLSGSRAEAPPAPVPRIDLARLERPRTVAEAGRRNIFGYGQAALPPAPRPEIVATPSPLPAPGSAAAAAAAALGGEPGVPSLPALNLKYIGTVENTRGVKVAVLMTDRREVLTGQAGQVVGNRYRIARIGLESVDLEDVATGQSRRLPLRGN
jgi:hypothetical protein